MKCENEGRTRPRDRKNKKSRRQCNTKRHVAKHATAASAEPTRRHKRTLRVSKKKPYCNTPLRTSVLILQRQLVLYKGQKAGRNSPYTPAQKRCLRMRNGTNFAICNSVSYRRKICENTRIENLEYTRIVTHVSHIVTMCYTRIKFRCARHATQKQCRETRNSARLRSHDVAEETPSFRNSRRNDGKR